MIHRAEASVVEVLENGDIIFEGRLVSAAELIVGSVLCDLRNASEFPNGESPRDESVANLPEVPSTSSGSSSSRSSSSALVYSNSKKRKYRLNSITLPNDDVRLQYKKMYFDAMNSGEGELVLKMLRDISVPSVVLVNRKLRHDPNFIMPHHIEVVGCEAIAALYEQYYIAAPDIVSTSSSHKINVFATGESVIKCDAVCTATKIREIRGLPEGGNKKVIVNSVVVDEFGVSVCSARLISTMIVENGNTSAATVTPVTVGAVKKERVHVMKMKVSLHLNANNKVFLIVVLYE